MNNIKQKTVLFLATCFLSSIAIFSFSVTECIKGNVYAQSNEELKEGDINKKIDESPEKPGSEFTGNNDVTPPLEQKKPKNINVSPGIKPKAVKTEKQNKAMTRKEAKNVKEVVNIKSVNPAPDGVRDDDLLDITEGAFKYKRIPGIKIADVARNSSKPLTGDKIEKPANDVSKNTGEKKGLFGLTIKNTDFLAKLILFGIIIVVFILYRYRTRGRRSSVLKRFPK
jgi:hypothetical protein